MQSADGLGWGNAVEACGADGRRGWFVGHFMPPQAGPAATGAVELKWGVHPAGASKRVEGVNRTASTISLLVRGRFRLDFPSCGHSITLERPGDCAIWSCGVPHQWHLLEDSIVITVRWPSRAQDQTVQTPAP